MIQPMNLRRVRVAMASLVLAGCAAVAPVEDLTWSRSLAKSLPLEQGPVVEAARFSKLRPNGSDLGDWQQFEVVRGNKPTNYHLVERDGVVVVQAESSAGGSGLFRKIRIDPHR